MTANEWSTYTRHAAKQGFIGYYEPGQPTCDRWRNQAPRGGVAVFVSKRLRQLRVAAFSGQHSQMLVASAQGYEFASLYVPPGHGGVPDTEACAFLTEWLSSQSAQQPWVLGTEVNAEVDDCESLQLLTSFGGYPKRVFRPTRWEGNREIDFLVTNRPALLGDPNTLTARISDHVPLVASLPSAEEDVKQGTLKPTPNFAKPETIEAAHWRLQMKQAWNQQESLPALEALLQRQQVEPDEEWACYQGLLHRARLPHLGTLLPKGAARGISGSTGPGEGRS